MNFFSKFLQRLYLGSALAIAASTFAAFVMPSEAKAQSDHSYANNEPDFSGYRFVPGKKWYRLNDELPASVVRIVEEQTGKRLCKIETSPGNFISNLMPCPDDHPRMYDSSIGRLRPMLHTGNTIGDWFDGNWAYDMRPGFAEIELAQLIKQAYNAETSPHQRADDHIRVAANAPVAIVAAATATVERPVLSRAAGPTLADETDTAEWTRKVSDGKSLKLLRRYADGQVVDVVLRGRGMKNRVFTVDIHHGKLKWHNASPELTQIALAPVEKSAPVLVASTIPFVTPFDWKGTGVDGTFLGAPQNSEAKDFYTRLFGDQTQYNIAGLGGPDKASPLSDLAFDQRFMALPKSFNVAATTPVLNQDEALPVQAELRPSIDATPQADVLPVVNAAATNVKVDTFKRNGQTYTKIASGDKVLHLATGRLSKDGTFAHPWAPGGLVKAFREEHEGRTTKYIDTQLDAAQARSLMAFVQAELRAKQASRLAMR